MIKDHRGIQIGWSVGGDFYKNKSDAPITDPLPVFKKIKSLRKKFPNHKVDLEYQVHQGQ